MQEKHVRLISCGQHKGLLENLLGVRREIGGHKDVVDVHRYAPLLDRAMGRSSVGFLIAY
jgi:hypothetical protein